jgi:hypothetical protein
MVKVLYAVGAGLQRRRVATLAAVTVDATGLMPHHTFTVQVAGNATETRLL